MPAPKLTAALLCALLALPGAVSANETEWLIAKGQAALGSDSPGDAYDYFNRALAKAPADPRLNYLAGVAAERADRLEAAAAHLAKAEAGAKRGEFPLDYAFGRLLFKQGKFEEAEKRFLSHVSANPDDAAGFVWLGETQLRLGRDEDAFKALNRAGKPEPRLRPIYHFSRAAKVFNANPADAVEELNKAVEADRNGPIADKAREFIALSGKKEELNRWYSIDGALGFQNDSNMLLNTEGDGTLRYAGNRVVFSVAAYARPKVGERFTLGFGANLNESQAFGVSPSGRLPSGDQPKRDNADFNLGSHTLFVDGAYTIPLAGSTLEPGLEYGLHYGRLGGETLDLSHGVYPRVTWFHTPVNATKVYGIVRFESYNDIDGLAPLAADKSGSVFGGGVAEYWVFSNRLDAVTVFAEFVSKSFAEGGYAGPRAGINGRKRIVADLYLDAGAFVAQRSYSGVEGRPSDLLVGADGGLGYLLFNHLEIDLNAGYNTNQSEDDFTYDRLLTGVFLRGIF